MKPLCSHLFLIAALTAIAISPLRLYANGPQVLLLDGKVHTKNISFEGVRMVVERNGVPVKMVTKDLRHFQLQLDLQQDYVITFHRESCMSKSLHIDTHVPQLALEAAPYSFPFLVTLEPRPKGAVVRYAEPVGQITFREEKEDFVYATDYSIIRDRKRSDLQHASRTPVLSDSKGAATKSGRTVGEPSIPSPLKEDLGPKFNKPLPTAAKNVPASVEPAITSLPMTAGHVVLDDLLPDGRSEEVQVRPTYVAKEVRITKQGHSKVYRKVTPRNGEIRYFCNGSSCSEATFLAATRH